MNWLLCITIAFLSNIYVYAYEIKTSTVHKMYASSHDEAQEWLKALTLEQKIGQLFIVPAVSDNFMNTQFMHESVYTMHEDHVKMLIAKYHIGGVIFLGIGQAHKQFVLTQQFQKQSAIPLLVCMDFEWGLGMRLRDGMSFVRNAALASLSPENDHLIYQLGFEIGMQCKALGVHINLAPVVDIVSSAKNILMKERSFGPDKHIVARKALLYMQGLQDAGIIACAKHFPGHGNTEIDSHYDLPRITSNLQNLNDVELYPFVEMINAGVMSVMSAHLEVPALESTPHLPASLSFNIMTKLLKEKLGFQGLIITDGLGMIGVTKYHTTGDLELKAVQAGNDVLLCSIDVPKAFLHIKNAILDGKYSEHELDQKVLKILQCKIWSHAGSMPDKFERQNLMSDSALLLQRTLLDNCLPCSESSTRNEEDFVRAYFRSRANMLSAVTNDLFTSPL